jgi:hypothetical protein
MVSFALANLTLASCDQTFKLALLRRELLSLFDDKIMKSRPEPCEIVVFIYN